MVQSDAGLTPLPELCENSQITFFAVFLCMHVRCPLWLCDHASFSRQIVKKKKKVSFMFVGKPRLAETGLYWRSERQISSQHWLCFFCHALAPAETPEPLLPASSESWFLPLSDLLWCEALEDCLVLTGRTDFAS